MHIDHIVAVSQGGTTTLENLAMACAKCNLTKGTERWQPAPEQPPEPPEFLCATCGALFYEEEEFASHLSRRSVIECGAGEAEEALAGSYFKWSCDAAEQPAGRP